LYVSINQKKVSRAKKTSSKEMSVAIDTSMRDYSNEPFFIKKADSAKKLIDKYGLPKQLLK
jgi:hypothetical protein